MKHIHRLLTSNKITRKLQRRLVHQLKSSMGCPDAYDDIANVIRNTRPDAVLDVGCHFGKTIDRILESNSLPVHGFEPTSNTYNYLSSKFKGHPLVSLHQVALSDRTGEAVLHCNANEQTNSLLDNDSGNQEMLPDYTKHVSSETIQTMTLDDWIKDLPNASVFIKSDVQGAEGLLLAGGAKSFKHSVVGFYSEAQIAPMYEGQADFCEIHRVLTKELGFFLHNIYPCFHDKTGRALQTDALWIREGSLFH